MVELPSVELPVLLPMGAVLVALEPEGGAPMAVLPGVAGPDMLLPAVEPIEGEVLIEPELLP